MKALALALLLCGCGDLAGDYRPGETAKKDCATFCTPYKLERFGWAAGRVMCICSPEVAK